MPRPSDPLTFYVRFRVPPGLVDEFLVFVGRFGSLVDRKSFVRGRGSANQLESTRKKRLENLARFIGPGEEYRIGSLYRVVMRGGYAQCFKTFSRDVAELALRGIVDARVVRGGRHGNTTFVRLK